MNNIQKSFKAKGLYRAKHDLGLREGGHYSDGLLPQTVGAIRGRQAQIAAAVNEPAPMVKASQPPVQPVRPNIAAMNPETRAALASADRILAGPAPVAAPPPPVALMANGQPYKSGRVGPKDYAVLVKQPSFDKANYDSMFGGYRDGKVPNLAGRGAVIPGLDPEQKDNVPVKVSSEEAILPRKTSHALNGLLQQTTGEDLPEFIERTNGKPPAGLRAGASYATGAFTAWNDLAADRPDLSNQQIDKRISSQRAFEANNAANQQAASRPSAQPRTGPTPFDRAESLGRGRTPLDTRINASQGGSMNYNSATPPAQPATPVQQARAGLQGAWDKVKGGAGKVSPKALGGSALKLAGKAAVLYGAGKTVYDTANADDQTELTDRYAERFGVDAPTGDGSFGDIAKFAALRAGGFASDLGNTLTGGLAGKLFYRDKPGATNVEQPQPQQPAVDPKVAEQAAAEKVALQQQVRSVLGTGPQGVGSDEPYTQEQRAAIGEGQREWLGAQPGMEGVDLNQPKNSFAQADMISRQTGGKGGLEAGMQQRLQYGRNAEVYGTSDRKDGKLNNFTGIGDGSTWESRNPQEHQAALNRAAKEKQGLNDAIMARAASGDRSDYNMAVQLAAGDGKLMKAVDEAHKGAGLKAAATQADPAGVYKQQLESEGKASDRQVALQLAHQDKQDALALRRDNLEIARANAAGAAQQRLDARGDKRLDQMTSRLESYAMEDGKVNADKFREAQAWIEKAAQLQKVAPEDLSREQLIDSLDKLGHRNDRGVSDLWNWLMGTPDPENSSPQDMVIVGEGPKDWLHGRTLKQANKKVIPASDRQGGGGVGPWAKRVNTADTVLSERERALAGGR